MTGSVVLTRTDIRTDGQNCYSNNIVLCMTLLGVVYYAKGQGFPYLLPSVGPRADPGAAYRQSARRWLEAIHPAVGRRLSLISARPAVTFPAEERQRPSAGTKLYCLVTEAHACEQLAQGCYLEAHRPRFEPPRPLGSRANTTVKPHRPLHPAIGCRNVIFPPGLRFPSQLQRITTTWPVPSYTVWWLRHISGLG